MKIAVVGAGVSGLVASRLLERQHQVTLFDASPVAGGHAHTVDVRHEGRSFAVDTGFVVYNEVTYPRFTALLAELGVATRPSDMSFSVRNESTGLEYCGSGFRALFAQPGNLFSPRFHRMLVDIARFHRSALAELARLGDDLRLGDLLREGRYSRPFVEDYLAPMTGAIWSTPAEKMLDAPAGFVVRFLANHGMLTANDHLQWRTIVGGSRSYVAALVAELRGRPRLGERVAAVRRLGNCVELAFTAGGSERFDQVVLAVHADQALALLPDADDEERALLTAIPFQENSVALHTDDTLLPRRSRARASWNYHAGGEKAAGVRLTYDMSRLQGLATSTPLLVTLNRDARIDPAKLLARFRYAHPRYEAGATAAQARLAARNGARRTFFCGAWMGHGFHEDGVASAHAVAEALAVELAA